MNIAVENYSTAKQKRPILFTMALAKGLPDLLQVGNDSIAHKQYDDGLDAVYVAPPPEDGWPIGFSPPTNIAVTAYTGADPQYRFQFHPSFAVDQCGSTPVFDLGFLPELVVDRPATSGGELVVRCSGLLPWTQGVHPVTNQPIPNGGSLRRYFSTSGHAEGWHLFFHIWFDSGSGVAEFAAEVMHSDHLARRMVAEGKTNPDDTDFWTVWCNHVTLRWPRGSEVKAKYVEEGHTFPTAHEMRLSTTFTSGTAQTGSSNGMYANWAGKWFSQYGMGFRGFLLRDRASYPDEGTRFDEAAAMFARFDAETWDGHWGGGGSSGHGLSSTIINQPAQVRARYGQTGMHFVTWDRGAGAADSVSNIGLTCKGSINATGGQGNMDGVYGHSVFLGANTIRDYEVASADACKRAHWVWADALNHDPITPTGWWYTERGRITVPSFAERGLPLMGFERGGPSSGLSNTYYFGRTGRGAERGMELPQTGGGNFFPGWDDNHMFNPTPCAAFRLTKDPFTYQMLSWFLNSTIEMNGRRPLNPGAQIGGSMGSRGPGRLFVTLANLWECAPGMRPRLWDIVYNPENGFYPYIRDHPNDVIAYRGNTGNHSPSEIRNLGPGACIKFMRHDESIHAKIAAAWTRLRGATRGFGSASEPGDVARFSPTWTMVGIQGLLAWYSALLRDDWNGRVDTTAAYVTDFGLWGQELAESALDWYFQRIPATGGWAWFPIYATVVYRGYQLWQTSGSTAAHPPLPPPHPFVDTVAGPGGTTVQHPEALKSKEAEELLFEPASSNVGSWSIGMLNWYRHYGRNQSYRVKAQERFEDMLRVRGGNAAKYHGWQQVFPAAIAPLLPMTMPTS